MIGTSHNTILEAPARQLTGKVEAYAASTSATPQTYLPTGNLVSFKVDRTCENSKFFGFGVPQKAEVVLLDTNRTINKNLVNTLKLYHGYNTNYINPYPIFYLSEIERDENNNQVKITAYDAINAAAAISYTDLNLTAPYTIGDLAAAVSNKLTNSTSYKTIPSTISEFSINLGQGANANESTTLREVLDDIAEATQTIYYIDNTNSLVFKRLDKTSDPVLTISKSTYFTLSAADSRTLATITHATELGDNVTYSASGITGETQYVRDNMLWNLQDNVGELVQAAVGVAAGTSITPFALEWRGNYQLEIGDKIAIAAKDDSSLVAYLLDDVITYDGSLKETTQWEYDENQSETAANPATIGDAINQTYAKVDKVNKQVEIVVSEVEDQKSNISQIQLDQDTIKASVEAVSNNQSETDTQVDNLIKRVNANMTAEQIEFLVQQKIANGVDSVTTSTGYSFNQDGLTISKSNVDISTNINEDGMRITKNNEVVLTANNSGVDAKNLHATTYLIIGNNSRFEDYNSTRTGCFWIGS